MVARVKGVLYPPPHLFYPVLSTSIPMAKGLSLEAAGPHACSARPFGTALKKTSRSPLSHMPQTRSLEALRGRLPIIGAPGLATCPWMPSPAAWQELFHGLLGCFPLQFLQSGMWTERWHIYVASVSEIVPDRHLSMTEAATLAPLRSPVRSIPRDRRCLTKLK